MGISWGGWKWFEDNWFNLLQSLGIVGSLVFTAIAMRRETKSRHLETLLSLGEHHRELWSELHRRPDLSRVLADEVDLVGQPVTTAEEEFLNTAFVHFCTGWRLATEHGVLAEDDLRRDIGQFLSHPIPRQVWKTTRQIREESFVRFGDKAMKRYRPPRRRLR